MVVLVDTSTVGVQAQPGQEQGQPPEDASEKARPHADRLGGPQGCPQARPEAERPTATGASVSTSPGPRQAASLAPPPTSSPAGAAGPTLPVPAALPPLLTQAPVLSCPSDLLLTIADQGEGGCSFVRVSVPGASRPWPLCDNAVWGPKSCPLLFSPSTLPTSDSPAWSWASPDLGGRLAASGFPALAALSPSRGGETCRDRPPAASGPGNS